MPGTIAMGRDQRCWVKKETTYGETPGSASADPYAATDALVCKIIEASEILNPLYPEEKINSRTKQAPVAGQYTAKWKLAGLLRGSGTPTTATDLDPLLECALGGAGSNSGSAIVYPLNKDAEKSISALIPMVTTDILTKNIIGGIVEEMTIKNTPEGFAEFEFSGPAARVWETGPCTVPGGAASADATITVDKPYRVGSGSILTVGSAGGEMLLVTNVNTSTGVLTVTRGWGTTSEAAIASGAQLIPLKLTSSTVSTQQPISGVLGAISIDSTSYKIISASLNLKNNFELLDNEVFTDRNQGLAASREREIKLAIEIRARLAVLDFVKKGKDYLQTKNISIDFGTVSGNIFRAAMPKAVLANVEINAPERDVVRISGDIMATHDTADSELTLSTL